MHWVVAFDASLTLAGIGLILVCLSLRSMSKEKLPPEYREYWLRTRQRGYGRFVLFRGVLACGGPVALTVGLLSLAFAFASRDTRPASFSVARSTAAGVPGVADTKVSSWAPLWMCLGAAVLPSLLIGAYVGDRLWHMRERWYLARETAGPP